MVLLGIFALQKIVAAEIGDANNDGVVNVADVVAAVNAANGQQADNFNLSAADMNGDGVITLEDAKLIAKKIISPEVDLSNALCDDYERAFAQGYLAKGYYYYDRKQQITSQEFKAMLKPLVEKYSPDKMDYFNSRISDANAPIPRYIAAGMAYYVARCIGLLIPNSPYHRSEYDNLWEGAWDDIELLDRILPYANVPSTDGDNDWIELINALLWHAEFVSIVSNKEIVAYNEEADSWLWSNPFTWEDAVRAITRFNDSFEPEIEYADIDDPRVTSPDASVITPRLIAETEQKEIHDISELPRLIGLFSAGNGKDIKEFAEWGFNSLKYNIGWKELFTDDMQVNLNLLRSIDEMVAASMKYGIHLSLGTYAVPGYGMYWAENYRDDYVMDCDILNPEKRKKAADVWRTIATRYKDVPNISLSFYPIQEPQVLNSPSGFGEAQSFTPDEIFDFVDLMVDAIKEISPERFIFYDAFSYSLPEKANDLLPYTIQQYNHMSEKYNNCRIVCNHMDMAYMFYEYNTGDGNIDWAHHSVWVPTYPITLYGVNGLLYAEGNDKLTIGGCLPEGTTINIYLASASNGTHLLIAEDEEKLYEENIEGDQSYNTGFAMAYGEQFRSSDKKISVKLKEKANEVTLSVSKGGLNWCGIEVVLPETYTVEKWRKDSDWDIELGLIAPEDAHRGEFYKKPTSTVQIGSTSNDEWISDIGFHITINDDVTFTSDSWYEKSDKKQTEKKVKDVCENFPIWSCRFEDVLVTDMAGALNYWDDTMEIFQRYNVDVWISAIGLLSEENLAPFRIADYEGEDFNGHHNFNVKLLRILQKYLDK
jgi:hypothetical protein